MLQNKQNTEKRRNGKKHANEVLIAFKKKLLFVFSVYNDYP